MSVVPSRLLELEYLEEVVSAGVDDDEVFVAVDGDGLGRVDVGGDAAVEGAGDRASGEDVARPVQQYAAVALVANDQVRRTVEAQARRLVHLVVARASPLPADSRRAYGTIKRYTVKCAIYSNWNVGGVPIGREPVGGNTTRPYCL